MTVQLSPSFLNASSAERVDCKKNSYNRSARNWRKLEITALTVGVKMESGGKALLDT